MAWHEIFHQPRLLKRFQQAGYALFHDQLDELDRQKIRLNKEKGASGTEVQGGEVQQDEYNPDFMGDEMFDRIRKMRNSDGAVKAALLVIKLPFLRTTWKIVTARENDSDAQNKLIAETCHRKLLEEGYIHESWSDQLRNRLLMFDYGFSVDERVYTIDTEGFLSYSRFAPRVPWSITGFKANPKSGELEQVIQRAYKNNKQQELKIDAPRYATVYSWEKEGDNYWGKSILRPMWKHYWYKEELYRIDAVRLDRWGIGIPDAFVKEGKTLKPAERNNLIKLLQRLRGNHQSYILRPEEVGLNILTPESRGGALGLMDSVNHHDTMMFRSILAGFLTTGNQEHGNYGSTRYYADLYLYNLQAACNFLEEEYTRQVIRQFCLDNFNMENRPFPRLRATDIQKIEIGLLSESLARFTNGGIITPDDDLEAFFRTLYGWPSLPKDFTRVARRERLERAGLNPDLEYGKFQTDPDGSGNNPFGNGTGQRPEGPGNPGRPPKPQGNENRRVDRPAD